jgi:hypothetical protein
MTFLLRLILVVVAAYLLIRYLIMIFFPGRRRDGTVRGAPRKKAGRIDEERIQDARFKDIHDR